MKAEDEIIGALWGYIDFLERANQVPITLAYIHGWRSPSSDVEEGEKLRLKLDSLRQTLCQKKDQI